MAFAINEKRYRADMAELAAYRATGLTPEAINRLIFPDPAPLPLDLRGDCDPALEAQMKREEEQWDK
ncbi:MAG: hypothetical protein PHH32_03215 [Eubacteriales bacterium]|nr:hypothetical protein [Eubacteriales bacterium]